MKESPNADPEAVDSIEIGGYWLTQSSSGVWLYGPDGDGMAMGIETLKKFEAVLAAFFKEHM